MPLDDDGASAAVSPEALPRVPTATLIRTSRPRSFSVPDLMSAAAAVSHEPLSRATVFQDGKAFEHPDIGISKEVLLAYQKVAARHKEIYVFATVNDPSRGELVKSFDIPDAHGNEQHSSLKAFDISAKTSSLAYASCGFVVEQRYSRINEEAAIIRGNQKLADLHRQKDLLKAADTDASAESPNAKYRMHDLSYPTQYFEVLQERWRFIPNVEVEQLNERITRTIVTKEMADGSQQKCFFEIRHDPETKMSHVFHASRADGPYIPLPALQKYYNGRYRWVISDHDMIYRAYLWANADPVAEAPLEPLPTVVLTPSGEVLDAWEDAIRSPRTIHERKAKGVPQERKDVGNCSAALEQRRIELNRQVALDCGFEGGDLICHSALSFTPPEFFQPDTMLGSKVVVEPTRIILFTDDRKFQHYSAGLYEQGYHVPANSAWRDWLSGGEHVASTRGFRAVPGVDSLAAVLQRKLHQQALAASGKQKMKAALQRRRSWGGEELANFVGASDFKAKQDDALTKPTVLPSVSAYSSPRGSFHQPAPKSPPGSEAALMSSKPSPYQVFPDEAFGIGAVGGGGKDQRQATLLSRARPSALVLQSARCFSPTSRCSPIPGSPRDRASPNSPHYSSPRYAVGSPRRGF